MPVHPVKAKGGKRIKGYKYGSKGKLYKGKGAKKKAIRQGIAIRISQGKR